MPSKVFYETPSSNDGDPMGYGKEEHGHDEEDYDSHREDENEEFDIPSI